MLSSNKKIGLARKGFRSIIQNARFWTTTEGLPSKKRLFLGLQWSFTWKDSNRNTKFKKPKLKMKILQTILKGKLTGLGLVGVLINDLLSNYPEAVSAWSNAVGSDASILQIVSAIAILWGVFRRFLPTYNRA